MKRIRGWVREGVREVWRQAEGESERVDILFHCTYVV